MNAREEAPVRLTHFGHGGGCGCKIAPVVLEQILAKSGSSLLRPELLVGTETSDDAAVYQINDSQAIVATTDFFMPKANRFCYPAGCLIVGARELPCQIKRRSRILTNSGMQRTWPAAISLCACDFV